MSRRFHSFALGVLAYTLAVIVWGAYVRASSSGAGCGSHWPLCNGNVIPLSPSFHTLVEFSHRITSGLSLLLVGILFAGAFRVFPRAHRVRKAAAWSLGFILSEALIGAVLVLYGWVAHDQSKARAVSVALHLTNTFFLLGALALTWIWSESENIDFDRRQIPAYGQGSLALGGVIGLGITGAITALGDTLFPSASLRAGMGEDWSAQSSFLIHLRIVHPVLAICVGLYIVFLGMNLGKLARVRNLKVLANALVGLACAQLVMGMANLILLAPIAVQLTHLLLANLLWVILVLTLEASGRADALGEEVALLQ